MYPPNKLDIRCTYKRCWDQQYSPMITHWLHEIDLIYVDKVLVPVIVFDHAI